MLIRLATLDDLESCLELDADSQTDHVWQMEQRHDNGRISVRFHAIRLPRVMRVAYPRPRDDLLSCVERGSMVLVATERAADDQDEDWLSEEGAQPPSRIYGYCQLDAAPWQAIGWIGHLIVDRQLRRQSIGTALLTACIAWGRHRRLGQLMVAIQTKNYPAISFCEKHGFSFSGFNDQYFPNRDIALFFSLKI
jgi:GNAT superfamily N-acetyltransferase